MTTVFVGNITDQAPDELIKEMLTKIGTIISWKRVRGASGKLQGFGYCEYIDPQTLLRALRLLNGYQVCDKKLLVKVDSKTRTELDEFKEQRLIEKEVLAGGKVNFDVETEPAVKKVDASIMAKIGKLVKAHCDENSIGILHNLKKSHSGDLENLQGMDKNNVATNLLADQIRKFRTTYDGCKDYQENEKYRQLPEKKYKEELEKNSDDINKKNDRYNKNCTDNGTKYSDSDGYSGKRYGDRKYNDRDRKHDDRDRKHDDRHNRNYDNRDTRYDDRSRNTKYDNKNTRDRKYDNRDRSYDNRGTKYDNRDTKYDDRNSNFDKRDTKHDNRDNCEKKYDKKQSKPVSISQEGFGSNVHSAQDPQGSPGSPPRSSPSPSYVLPGKDMFGRDVSERGRAISPDETPDYRDRSRSREGNRSQEANEGMEKDYFRGDQVSEINEGSEYRTGYGGQGFNKGPEQRSMLEFGLDGRAVPPQPMVGYSQGSQGVPNIQWKPY